MVNRRRTWTAAAGLMLLLAALLAVVVPSRAAAKPTAVVAVGDSEISGEGAGSYQSGTNGPTDYCHRSLKAWIMVAPIPVDAHVNLACSGARSANLALGGSGQYGEPSQADQLAAVAQQYRVKAVFVTVGANDDPRFGSTAYDCVSAYMLLQGADDGCAAVDGPTWQSRVDAMVPKAVGAVAGVQAAMTQAGYHAGAYQTVVVSYASPTPHTMRYADWQYLSKQYHGCPVYGADARWGHDVATPALDAGERTVAGTASVRFLDLVSGFAGHELCASGISSSQEWIRGLTYDTSSTTWWNSHAVQQSLHPNAAGHAQIASCAAAFFAATYREGTCRLGADGWLHPQALG